jgi:hypothetical protein
MTKEEVQARLAVKPFVPLVVRIVGGKEIVVPAREYVHLAPGGRTMIVFQDNDGIEFVKVADIAALEEKECA